MNDNSFGKVIIENSRFFGDYDDQSGDYSINYNWLYNPDTNSINWLNLISQTR